MRQLATLIVFAIATLGVAATAAAQEPTLDRATIPEAPDVLPEQIDPILDGHWGDAPPSADSNSPGDADGFAQRRRTRRTYRTYRTHRRPSRRVVVVTRSQDRRPAGRVLARPEKRTQVSAGLRFSAVSIGDTEIGNETFHGATLGGVGGYVRGKFHEYFGMEFSVDIMGNFEDEYDQLSIPVLAGITAHILPSSKLDIYGIIGGGVLINSLDYQATDPKAGTSRTFSENYLQLAGQAGGGLELDLGALELLADVRYLLLQARPERDEDLKAAVPMEAGGSEDSVTHAVQFMVGLGGNF